MKHLIRLSGVVAASLLAATSCTTDDGLFNVTPENSNLKINLSGEITQVYNSRVNDNGFCDGDKVGIYVVDYNGDTPGTLLAQGNRADNVGHTYDEAARVWNAAYDIYYKDNKTKVDIYGYYPFSTPDNIEAYPFELEKDQSTVAADGALGGYEASDFLWGKVEKVTPSDRVVSIAFRHMMASARVTMKEGTGFDEGEWASVEKSVIMMSTTRKSTIDLSTGIVTPTGDIPTTGTIPYESNGDYRSIIVPQTIETGKTIALITVGGTPYQFKKDEPFTYIASRQHNFTITVNKHIGSGYEFVLTSESITAWENDNVSHDASAREYIVINVEEPGMLAESIVAAGKDLAQVQNLKLTGQITSKDFWTMRSDMPKLRALNLKEVVIKKGEGVPGDDYYSCEDDEIPARAMFQRESLVSLVLPDRLKKISESAFYQCSNLSGSLIIPEGTEEIGKAAFFECTSLNGTLSLPSSLKKIGEATGYTSYWDGPFKGCNFVCELKIPESVTVIGMGAFYGCKNLYGELRLPENLKILGAGAFQDCRNLQGALSIPQGVVNIPEHCFDGCWLGGTLTLHDGITTIGDGAFANNGFKGELRLPKDLEVLSHSVFYNGDFSGELVLPAKVTTIGDYCFAYNWRLTGVVEIPEKVLSIGAGAFAKCRSIEGVIFPEGLESIRCNETMFEDGGAFQDCFGIGRIVCKGSIPAYIQDGAFHGVAKDNFTVEVPESAIAQYQSAVGWKDFKRISAYRNLVVRPSVATAINTSVTRELVLNAEAEWEVESKPDWISLDKTSGVDKAEIKMTFSSMPRGSEAREGEVVFKLKDKDYRTRCKVTQYDYEYDEDQIITLQSASRGNGVNLVFLGEGYNAKDISDGKMMSNITEAVEHFFNIEPYKTYRDYFNVYTGIAVSPESGIGSVNTIVYNRFNTTAKGGVTLGGRNADDSDYREILKYACKAPTVSDANIGQTLVVIIANTSDYGGICYMYDDGSAIAYCPLSDYGYPLDFRGVVQHEAGGHGFGKLGDEYIYHNAFINNCSCTCCGHVLEFNGAKSKGWYANLSLSGKMDAVPWSHFIFHEKYNQVVDIFEGGYMHSRGVYRSEQNSCMNNDIPYHSAISRETIVKRIKAIAGEAYSFEDFVANDVLDASSVESRALTPTGATRGVIGHHEPVFMGRRPNIK